MVSKIDLGLLDAYKLMYFDRNINGNNDDKNLDCDYCVCVTQREFHFSSRLLDFNLLHTYIFFYLGKLKLCIEISFLSMIFPHGP